MRYIFKTKKVKRYKKQDVKKVIGLTGVLIIFLTIFLLVNFTKKIDNNLLAISESELKRVTYSLITEEIDSQVLNKENLNDILIINKNKEGEILYVDFKLDKAYQLLDDISQVLTNTFKNIENSSLNIAYLDQKLTHKANSFILQIPLGSTLNSLYFYNLGPKIPVQINFIGSVLTNLETKITNYGMNNALVEIYAYIELNSNIIGLGNKKEVNLKYNSLVAAMMIEGKVPQVYGGIIDTKSNVYQKEFN